MLLAELDGDLRSESLVKELRDAIRRHHPILDVDNKLARSIVLALMKHRIPQKKALRIVEDAATALSSTSQVNSFVCLTSPNFLSWMVKLLFSFFICNSTDQTNCYRFLLRVPVTKFWTRQIFCHVSFSFARPCTWNHGTV